MKIIAALENDSARLTEIAFSAKRHWNYPSAYYDLWKDELTITKPYIRNNIVFKMVDKGETLGFYSIIQLDKDTKSGETIIQKGYWLEHIFISPEFHKKGIGTKMILHLKKLCKKNGIPYLIIFVDPFAKGFYDKIGAEYLYETKSSIPNRMIPVYKLVI